MPTPNLKNGEKNTQLFHCTLCETHKSLQIFLRPQLEVTAMYTWCLTSNPSLPNEGSAKYHLGVLWEIMEYINILKF